MFICGGRLTVIRYQTFLVWAALPLVMTLLMPSEATAATILNCKTTKYNQSRYPEDWAKSWVPSQHKLEITHQKVVSIKPDFFEADNNMRNVFEDNDDLDLAIEAY